MLTDTVKDILHEIADIRQAPQGEAYNIRVDGKSAARNSTRTIRIDSKADVSGIDVHVAAGAKKQTVHIPVVITDTGLSEVVYNDFYIGEDAEVTIVAGCGIHNCGGLRSQHDGVHSFHVGKNARVTYTEKHYGAGDGTGERVLNPVTRVFLGEGGYMQMDTVQIKGVDSTRRETFADLDAGSTLVIKEKLMTHANQTAQTEFTINLDGEDCSADVVSRSVAMGSSEQIFLSKMNGNGNCRGHSECDAIIMDSASVKAIPEIAANSVNAQLIHEAAIGKIAGEQITKLMTLGLTQSEAEQRIVEGFLR